MPSDDELRKVAEDVRALARALSRDVRDAVEQARRSGHTTSGAVREGIRSVGADTRRNLRHYGPPGPCWWWGRGPHWGGRPWTPPGQPGDPAGADPSSAGGSSGGPPPWAGGRPGYAGGPPRAGPAWHRSPRPRPSRPPFPPIRRRWDATTLIGMLVVVFGLAWLVTAVGALHLSVEGVVAVGLMLLGACLVVTARTDWSLSRRSWPVWLGAGMIVVLVCTSTTFGIGNTLSSVSFGNTSPQVMSLPHGTVHGGFGNLNVDLTKTQGLAGGSLDVVSIAGNTTIELPTSQALNVAINARVVGGQICVNGRDVGDGLFAHPISTIQLNGADPTSPTFTLKVHQVFGQVQIGTGSNGGGCSGQHQPTSGTSTTSSTTASTTAR